MERELQKNVKALKDAGVGVDGMNKVLVDGNKTLEDSQGKTTKFGGILDKTGEQGQGLSWQ